MGALSSFPTRFFSNAGQLFHHKYDATYQSPEPTSENSSKKLSEKPERDQTSTLPSAENGSTGLYFGVSHHRSPTMKDSSTTFQTVS
jgi:hypothetical protein